MQGNDMHISFANCMMLITLKWDEATDDGCGLVEIKNS